MRHATLLAYRAKAAELHSRARLDLGRARVSHHEFVDWLINQHRIGLARSTWRFYRRSCVVELRHLAKPGFHAAATLTALADRLEATRAHPDGPSEPRTSAKKAKHFGPDDFDKVASAADQSAAVHAKELKSMLASTLMSGLRPCEWANAVWREPLENGAPHVLHVRCAKHSPERALETRTLVYDDLSMDAAVTMRNWMSCVGAHVAAGTYDRLIATLSRLLRRIVGKLFPRRTKRPSLYSARHQALADFKTEYIEIHCDPVLREAGAAIVAVLAGHLSDLSATQHYARAGKRGVRKWPLPRALTAEVKDVRKRLGERQEKFATFLAACAKVEMLR